MTLLRTAAADTVVQQLPDYAGISKRFATGFAEHIQNRLWQIARNTVVDELGSNTNLAESEAYLNDMVKRLEPHVFETRKPYVFICYNPKRFVSPAE